MADEKNTIRMKILDDGAVTVTTGGFQGEQTHMQAEELIKATFDDLGGDVTKKSRPKDREGHTHTHQYVGH